MDLQTGGRADRQPGGRASGRACSRHAIICTYLAPAVDALRRACSQTYITCVHWAAVDGPAKAAGAVGWTCGRAYRQSDSLVDVRPQKHAHAMLLFARSWHLHWMPCDVHVRSRGTAGAARAGELPSWVDVPPGGHVHTMLLFACICHLHWMRCDVRVHKTILLACTWQP